MKKIVIIGVFILLLGLLFKFFMFEKLEKNCGKYREGLRAGTCSKDAPFYCGKRYYSGGKGVDNTGCGMMFGDIID